MYTPHPNKSESQAMSAASASQDHDRQQQQQRQQQQTGVKKDNSTSGPSSVIHSTHSNLETFDQKTREQNSGISNTNTDINDISDHNNSASSTMGSNMSSEGMSSSEQEANSAVQLDRDIHKSRRVADGDRQKASGGARENSFSNQGNLSYVE
ncbi:hypothetical protein EDD11_004404 [Mortierella claussenii]|nr:hypothetical protein EDD11_004404 [Mortierella claussenii]